MGASCDLFYVSMDNYHGKINYLGNVGHTPQMRFPAVKGSFTTVKVTPCNRTYYIILRDFTRELLLDTSRYSDKFLGNLIFF